MITAFVFYILGHNTHVPETAAFKTAIDTPKPLWYWATVSGLAFGMVAFFSVFIFMFKGRTATFAGLVNRLTSLVAGTAATLVFAFSFGGKYPTDEDWMTLGFILVAVYFLTKAEKKRTKELHIA
jgi:drug/metabolite transporter (DMT)-like permease